MIDKARKACYSEDFEIDINGNIYALDSSTVDLCMSVFWWAKFRSTKSGINLHTLYDTKTSIPVYIHISEAKMHDVKILDILEYEAGSFYMMDKAYVDFKRLYVLHKKNAYFITRTKNNMRFKRMYSRKVDKKNDVKYDQIGKLEGVNSRWKYPEKNMKSKIL